MRPLSLYRAPPGPRAVEPGGLVSSQPLRLMAVHAHPDDESSKGAAATARYAAEGVEVLVVTCTGGERGVVHYHKTPPVVVGLDAMRVVTERAMTLADYVLGV